jgi:hypothetical protein
MRALRYAGGLYAVGLVLHTADHVRRGLDVLTPEVSVAGYLSIGGGLLVLALILYGHRLAPIAAVAYGLPAAIGTAASHLLPHWSSFSDAFPGAHGTGVTGVSWGRRAARDRRSRGLGRGRPGLPPPGAGPADERDAELASAVVGALAGQPLELTHPLPVEIGEVVRMHHHGSILSVRSLQHQ